LENDAKRVQGGTGWTVQLALDQDKEVYLFDIPSQTWYRSENHYYVSDDSACLVASSKFLPGVSNPPPFIKTRKEIQALFNRTFCLPENIEQLRLELEDFHL